MGFDDPCFRDSEDDMIRTLLDSPHPFVKGITLEDWIANIASVCGSPRRSCRSPPAASALPMESATSTPRHWTTPRP